jgi:hypothetical protein
VSNEFSPPSLSTSWIECSILRPLKSGGSSVGKNARLSGWERFLLFLPIPSTFIFGLGLFVIPGVLIPLLGYAGDDPYIDRIAGAATFPYAVALALALNRGAWLESRFVVLATLVFNLAALFACAFEFAAGRAQWLVYLLVANSAGQVVAMAWLLVGHRDVPSGNPNIPGSAVGLMAFAMIAALGTGLIPLLFPVELGHALGYKASDVLLFRLAGGATVGYAAMAVAQLRSRHWSEMRLPVTMAMLFNGLGLIASLISLARGEPALLAAVVLLVCLIVTPLAAYALVRLK